MQTGSLMLLLQQGPNSHAGLQGVVSSLEACVDGWESWYRASQPESSQLPGDWEAKCNELQRMVLVRCLRSVLYPWLHLAYQPDCTVLLLRI